MTTLSKKGASSRDAVIQTAKRLFATRGYPETSIQQIADAVGRSQSAVMHYFPSKADIFAAVLDEMVAVNEQIRASTEDPTANALDRMMAHFEINYRWAVETENHAQIMIGLFHFASYDDTFRNLNTAVTGKAQRRLVELVHAGGREKLFALPPSPEHAAEILHDGLLGFLVANVTTVRPTNTKASLLAKWKELVAAVTGHELTEYL